MSRWPFHRAYFWQEAPAFRPLLGLCAGIVCYDSGIPERSFLYWILSGLISTILLLVLVGFGRRKLYWQSVLFFVSFWLSFAFLGWSVSAANDPKIYRSWFGHHLDTTAAWLVKLEEDPQPRANSFRARATVLYKFDGALQSRVAGRSLLYLSKDCSELPKGGDTLLIPQSWSAIRNRANPFAFDNARHQKRQAIFYQQFLPPESYRRVGSMKPSERSLLERVHLWCGKQLHAFIQDSATLGLLQAMILGDEQALDPDLRQTYSETGVVHIVSISGAHVAVLFLLVTGLLRWIRGVKGIWIRYGVGLLLVWWYVLMAGAPPSALRSAVMFSVIALSVLGGMQGQALNTLASAALILLIGNPNWLFSVGFQLSFLAVLSMMLFYMPFYRFWPFKIRPFNWLGQALAASLAAEVLTAPLVIYYFHNFPIFFLAANLLAAVLVGMLALVGGMAVIATSGLPPLARIVGWLLQECVQVFNHSMQFLQNKTPETFHYLQIDFPELLLIYLSIAALAFGWLKKEVRALWLVFPALIVLTAFLSLDFLEAQRQDRLVVYDNGSKPLVERIRGQYHQRLVGAPGPNLNADAAHMGWHSWREAGSLIRSPLFRMGGQKILVLTDSNLNENAPSLPVEVLVWAAEGRLPKPESLLNTFHPKTLVVARRLWSSKRDEWTSSCAKHAVRLHEVGKDGAFVIE